MFNWHPLKLNYILIFFKQTERETRSKLPLKAQIVKPIQRIPRYELLLKVSFYIDHIVLNVSHHSHVWPTSQCVTCISYISRCHRCDLLLNVSHVSKWNMYDLLLNVSQIWHTSSCVTTRIMNCCAFIKVSMTIPMPQSQTLTLSTCSTHHKTCVVQVSTVCLYLCYELLVQIVSIETLLIKLVSHWGNIDWQYSPHSLHFYWLRVGEG